MAIFKKYSIDNIRIVLPRDELIRRSRILVVDDERPDIIDDLKKSAFSVDHLTDINTDNLYYIENRIYDLILLDFANVGRSLGSDEGLSLLKHIKRVSPSTIVIAYTSKALTSKQADFYRLADGVLSKDAGVSQSLEKIEEGLQRAHSIKNIWSSLISIVGFKEGSKEDKEWQNLFVQSLNSGRKRKQLKLKLEALLTSDASKKIGLGLLEKAIELGVRAVLGV